MDPPNKKSSQPWQFSLWALVLVRNLEDAGFTIKDIKYVPVMPKDLFLLLPLALLIDPIQLLILLKNLNWSKINT